MKISRQWLADFVALEDVDDARLEELITTRIAEVEGVELSGLPLAHAEVVRILKTSKHPESKKLQIVTIDTKSGEREIVCGASNAREGLVTAFVAPGGVVADGKGGSFTIETRKVAGVESPGILVSASELDVAAESDGILELDSEFELGTSLTQIFGEVDTVFEIDNKSLTHRPDLWGHYGFARELSGILRKPLICNLDEYSDATSRGQDKLGSIATSTELSGWTVENETKDGSARFTVVEISGVEVQPSPVKLQRRLFSVGAGIRNILVDLSNYVMLETGQPNHTYDASELEGKSLVVRFADEKETFRGLDDKQYKLSSDDLVIADSKGVVALAGIIGGFDSAVSDKTNRIILESANFDPVIVRKTGKRHGVRTDASNRFEKGRTPFATPLATLRFIELLTKYQPAVQVSSNFVDSFSTQPKQVKIEVPDGYIAQRLGVNLTDEQVSDILAGVGFESNRLKSGFEYVVPWYRPERDVSEPEDLVEEVGRIYGYENVPEQAPEISASASKRSAIKELEYSIADFLRGAGFSQFESESFVSSELESSLGFKDSSGVFVKNPVDVNNAKLRSSLVPGLLEAVCFNSKYQSDGLFFEIGRVYSSECPDVKPKSQAEYKDAPVYESRKLSIGSFKCAKETEPGELFFSLRSLIPRLTGLITSEEVSIRSFGIDTDLACAWMHPFRAGVVEIGGVAVGQIAEIKPSLVNKCRAACVEIDLELLLDRSLERAFTSLPKFPESFFEVSVVLPKRDSFSELKSLLVASVSSELLKGVEFLSLYEGEPLDSDMKSVSVKLMFGAADRTLSSEETESLQASVVAAIDGSEYSLRS